MNIDRLASIYLEITSTVEAYKIIIIIEYIYIAPKSKVQWRFTILIKAKKKYIKIPKWSIKYWL